MKKIKPISLELEGSIKKHHELIEFVKKQQSVFISSLGIPKSALGSDKK